MLTLSPAFARLREKLPEAAKDLKLNLQTVLAAEQLSLRQRLGTLIACAFATGSAELLAAAREQCGDELSLEDHAAAERIAATMGMNNIYYRFLHLVEDEEYARLPARLRMQALAHPPGDKLDRELWALAVSALNGCGQCIQAHEKVLREAGATRPQIQDAVRIAAVLGAVKVALGQA
jgi:alkyl hydroperoxide reductase subunit D